MKIWVGNACERLCGLLDAIPGYWDGHWHRYGLWGCQVGVSRVWAHWGTGR